MTITDFCSIAQVLTIRNISVAAESGALRHGNPWIRQVDRDEKESAAAGKLSPSNSGGKIVQIKDTIFQGSFRGDGVDEGSGDRPDIVGVLVELQHCSLESDHADPAATNFHHVLALDKVSLKG